LLFFGFWFGVGSCELVEVFVKFGVFADDWTSFKGLFGVEACGPDVAPVCGHFLQNFEEFFGFFNAVVGGGGGGPAEISGLAQVCFGA
jgi:hypothetical protein